MEANEGVIARIPSQDEAARRLARDADLYRRLCVVEGVLERLVMRLANAQDLADVNIAAGRASQEMVDGV